MRIVQIHQPENLARFKRADADAVIVDAGPYAIRAEEKQPLESLYGWKAACDKAGLKLFVNAEKLLMQPDLPVFEHVLEVLRDTADGIYVSDEGFLYGAKKMGLLDKCIYQPDTLIANHMEIRFYLDLGLQAVSLAHELSFREIESLMQALTPEERAKVELLAHGYHSILYSRRPLLENYFAQVNRTYPGGRLDLIEETRKERMPVLQDEAGTHIFSAQPVDSSAWMERLEKSGLERFRFGGFGLSDEELLQVLEAYQHPESAAKRGSDFWYGQESTIWKGEAK